MTLRRGAARAGLAAAVAAAAGGVGEMFRRGRSGRKAPRSPEPPPPPLTTQSSPGQIADLQQAYGGDMAPPSSPPAGTGTEGG